MSDSKKVQLNVYIPEAKREYLHSIAEEIDISQSDLMWMMIDYFENNMDTEQIKNMRRNMLLFGKAT